MGCAPVPAEARRARPFRRRQQVRVARLAGGHALALAVARIPGLRAARLRRLEAAAVAGAAARLPADARGFRRGHANRRARRHATDGWSCCRGSRARPMPGPAGTGSTRRPAPAAAKRRSSPRRFAPCAARTACTRDGYSPPACPPAAALPRCWACAIRRCSPAWPCIPAVACGAASGPMAAMQVLAHGADTAVEADRRERARRRAPARVAGPVAGRARRRRPRRLAAQCATARAPVPGVQRPPRRARDGAGRAAAARPRDRRNSSRPDAR